MKHLNMEVDEEIYDRFWDMKNDECQEIDDALNHDEALEFLLDTYDFVKSFEGQKEEGIFA